MWASDEAGIKRTCKAVMVKVPPIGFALVIVGFIGFAIVVIEYFEILRKVIEN